MLDNSSKPVSSQLIILRVTLWLCSILHCQHFLDIVFLNTTACLLDTVLMPIILATWEAEIGRISVQSQLRQIVCETPPNSKITRKKWTGVWLMWWSACFASVSPEFKL
jgi:hypothetical protein